MGVIKIVLNDTSHEIVEAINKLVAQAKNQGKQLDFIKEKLMAAVTEEQLKAIVTEAVGTVTANIKAAIDAETTEVAAQIAAALAKEPGVSLETAAAIASMVTGLGASAVAAVGAISDNDGPVAPPPVGP